MEKTTEAYFAFEDSSAKEPFIIQLTDPAKIQEARDILSGKQTTKTHVGGIIVTNRTPYNPAWSFHLKPESIGFFQKAMEVCDSTMRLVEEHLSEVGGDFLPNNRWCPWQSRMVREISTSEVRKYENSVPQ